MFKILVQKLSLKTTLVTFFQYLLRANELRYKLIKSSIYISLSNPIPFPLKYWQYNKVQRQFMGQSISPKSLVIYYTQFVSRNDMKKSVCDRLRESNGSEVNALSHKSCSGPSWWLGMSRCHGRMRSITGHIVVHQWSEQGWGALKWWLFISPSEALLF